MGTTLSTFEYIFGVAAGYFLFTYFPMRLLTCIFLEKKYHEYIRPTFSWSPLQNTIYGAAMGALHPYGIRILYRRYIKQPPKWLDYLSVFIFTHDMGFIITLLMGGFLADW